MSMLEAYQAMADERQVLYHESGNRSIRVRIIEVSCTGQLCRVVPVGVGKTRYAFLDELTQALVQS